MHKIKCRWEKEILEKNLIKIVDFWDIIVENLKEKTRGKQEKQIDDDNIPYDKRIVEKKMTGNCILERK